MSQEAVEKLLGRLLTDDRLRNRAMKSLEDVCRSEGYQLTSEEMQLITSEDLVRIEMIAERLDGKIKRFSM